jgi:hypothetical protein
MEAARSWKSCRSDEMRRKLIFGDYIKLSVFASRVSTGKSGVPTEKKRRDGN